MVANDPELRVTAPVVAAAVVPSQKKASEMLAMAKTANETMTIVFMLKVYNILHYLT